MNYIVIFLHNIKVGGQAVHHPLTFLEVAKHDKYLACLVIFVNYKRNVSGNTTALEVIHLFFQNCDSPITF